MHKELTAGPAAASVLLRGDRPFWADGKNEARFSDVRLVGEFNLNIPASFGLRQCGQYGYVAIDPYVVRLAAATGYS